MFTGRLVKECYNKIAEFDRKLVTINYNFIYYTLMKLFASLQEKDLSVNLCYNEIL